MREIAIRNVHPTVVQVDGEINAKDANGNIVVLDEAKITIEVAKLQAEYNAQTYARNRARGYPSTGDQLDMMYKDMKNSTTTHADAVEAVKTKWPKDNSGPGPEVVEEESVEEEPADEVVEEESVEEEPADE